jgi:hypothetical protein
MNSLSRENNSRQLNVLRTRLEELKNHQDINLIEQQTIAWTNGQPELTERIYELVIENRLKNVSPLRKEDINDLIQSHFQLNLLASNDYKEVKVQKLLSEIHEALCQENHTLERLKEYQKILLSNKQRIYSGSPEQDYLKEIGLIVIDSNQKISVANLIYKKIFNLDWAESKLDQLLNKKTFDKYHLALITGIISILIFSLFQGFVRYSPYARLIQCNNNSALREAIDANISLEEQKIDASIRQLKELQNEQKLSRNCEVILHDLQYSQAIYVRAGINSNPMEAVKTLCDIPERYYIERDIQPWFTRWTSLYRKTNFSQDLSQFLSANTCSASTFLSR